MENKGNLWLIVRVCWIFVGLLQSGWFLGALSGDFSRPSWSFAFEMSAVVAIGLVFIIGLQGRRFFGSSEDTWLRPSWFANPFDYRQPVIFFDAASYYALALAVGCAVIGLSRSPANWAWELPFSIRCGFWIGVRLCLITFPGSFKSGEHV